MPEDLDISFVIITNGQRDGLLCTIIEGIKYQCIPKYEVIVIGESKIKNNHPEVNYIESKEYSSEGLLGAMRNLACAQAKYNNMVISDDDMILSSNWYETLKQSEDFDILTTQVRNPDGTRYWDYACYQSPEKGHVVMNSEEVDDHTYMSGGQSWIMKKKVFEKVKWNEKFSTGVRANMKNLEEYKKGNHNEDTDFSKKCREAGFKIKHNHNLISYHHDKTYTSIGKVVRRRVDNRSYEWVRKLDKHFPAEIYAAFAASLFNAGFHAESVDVIRYALKLHYQNYALVESLKSLQQAYGEDLNDIEWNENGYPPYLKDLETYRLRSKDFYYDH